MISEADTSDKYVDLQDVPRILQAAGVQLMLADWRTRLSNEIKRRQSLTRASSSASIATSTEADGTASSSASVAKQPNTSHGPSDSIESSMCVFEEGNTTDTDTHEVQDGDPTANADVVGITIKWPTHNVPNDVPHMGLQLVDAAAGSSRQPQHQPQQPQQQVPHGNRLRPCVLARLNTRDQKAYLESLTKDDLVHVCMQQIARGTKLETKVEGMSRARKAWSQSTRRLKKQLDKQKAQMKTMKAEDQDDELQVKRKNSCKLTWKGLVSLGLRKGIALVSANSFPQASLVDVSRQSVCRAEILCAAYLIIRTHTFHQMMYYLLLKLASMQDPAHSPDGRPPDADSADAPAFQLVSLDPGSQAHEVPCLSQDDMICAELGVPSTNDPQTFPNMLPRTSSKSISLGSTYFCGDATNSSIWQCQKLQGLMVKSSWVTNWTALEQRHYDDAFTSQTTMLHASNYVVFRTRRISKPLSCKVCFKVFNA